MAYDARVAIDREIDAERGHQSGLGRVHGPKVSYLNPYVYTLFQRKGFTLVT